MAVEAVVVGVVADVVVVAASGSVVCLERLRVIYLSSFKRLLVFLSAKLGYTTGEANSVEERGGEFNNSLSSALTVVLELELEFVCEGVE